MKLPAARSGVFGNGIKKGQRMCSDLGGARALSSIRQVGGRHLPSTNFYRLRPAGGKRRFPLCRRWSNSRIDYEGFWKHQPCFHILRAQVNRRLERPLFNLGSRHECKEGGGYHGKAHRPATV